MFAKNGLRRVCEREEREQSAFTAEILCELRANSEETGGLA